MGSSDLSGDDLGFAFDNTYARLPEVLHVRLPPVPVRKPDMIISNLVLAEKMGLDPARLNSEQAVAVFAGNLLPVGAQPLAQAYAGHQFGHFTMLGDGRAILLGEHLAPDGTRYDIQLKGSGQTPFSRRGDGRAALGPMLREYLISEAMHGLGIPTTRSLAVVSTGEPVYREKALPGAILTRVAASHIRVGTFQYLAGREETQAMRTLSAYTLRRHFPEHMDERNPAPALLQSVVSSQAALVAQWMLVGFVHGVMNTDNMSLAGETMDYGPCAFMDNYDPSTVFSSIDQHGRYAYGNQPRIAQWNLARLAEALLPLLDTDEQKAFSLAEQAVEAFTPAFEQARLAGMRAKLGLITAEGDDQELIQDLLACMQRLKADYTATLRHLSLPVLPDEPLYREADFLQWHARWQSRLARQAGSAEEARKLMRTCNPAFIARNHQVEKALQAAVQDNDLSLVQRLLSVLSRPYADQPEHEDLGRPPPASWRGYQTFCGT